MQIEEKEMNKQGIRAFSFGIIFTISIIGSYYFYFNQPSKSQIKLSSAKQLLQKNGYVILSKKEYKKVINKQASESAKSGGLKIQKSPTQTSDNVPSVRTFHLQIVSGMTSEDIGHILAVQKIIENEGEFQQYLISHQYHTKIQLGSYDLTNKMDYEQIAKTITKNR